MELRVALMLIVIPVAVIFYTTIYPLLQKL